MLAFLFRGLTADGQRNTALFDALTAQARQPHWYREGEVPDTLDGRFAVLATVTALALVRLEREGDEANRASVALTERFVEVMESEHRELGLGDPTLGKVVRKLVGMLARRTELWRTATSGGAEWDQATLDSLYKGEASEEAIAHSAAAIRELWDQLDRASLGEVEKGKFG